MKIALYGGSFDPVHFGHLILAREAREKLALDRVVFIPAAQSPHKMARPPAPAEARLEMLRLAVEGEEGFEVDDLELRRPPPSFAIDTVRKYRQRHPDAELFYLLGSDNRAELETWHEINALRREVRFLWLGRSDGPAEEPEITRRVDISATEIRKRVAMGRSVRYLLPEKACEVIYRQGLYRQLHP